MKTTTATTTSARHEASAAWSLQPVRFMQLALATAVFLSLSYIWQFTMEAVGTISTTAVESTNAHNVAADGVLTVQRDRSRAHTHYVVRGFEEAHRLVREYDVETQGPLFLLFVKIFPSVSIYEVKETLPEAAAEVPERETRETGGGQWQPAR